MPPRSPRRSALAAGAALLAAACGDALSSVGSGGGAPPMEVPLEEVAPVVYSRVIAPAVVMLEDGEEPVADVARALLRERVPAAGARVDSIVPLAYSRGFVAPLSEAELAGMADDPRVAYSEGDREAVAAQSPSWALDRMNQRALPLDANAAVTGNGSGVEVHILDTGVLAAHTEFGGRVVSGPDFVDGTPTASGDCHGHGTLSASDAAGGRLGLASSARIVNVRVLGCSGSGSSVGIVQALDWVAARKAARPATAIVANLSLGVAGGSVAVDDAVSRATQAGVVVVVAAGNAGANACTFSPARAPSAITVGATDRADNRASFSNYGSCVDVYAPGAGVDGASSSSTTGYVVWNGTSAASPYVAGVAALYVEQYPDATPAQVAQALVSTATANVLRGTNATPNRLVFSGLTLPPSTATPPTGGVTAPAIPGPPTPAASVTCVRRACAFDGRASTDAVGIRTWRWSYGDGGSGSGATASRTYKSDGRFPVQLTVTNAAGLTATRIDTVAVTDSAPRAAFSASCTGWACTFDATGSRDDGRITRYAWAFGDGRVQTTTTPVGRRTYTAAGTFTVRLIVTDDTRQVDTTTVSVTPPPRPPTPAIRISCLARNCTFDGSASRDDTGVATYTWDFLDGSLQTGARVTRSYPAAGTYGVKLTVRSTTGLATSLSGRFVLR